tara:strand:- start:222 stop:671 length:450 start_codon:yes stop_codon:yes gene_type:complete
MGIKIVQINDKFKSDFVKIFKESYFDSEEEAKQHFKEYLKSKRLFVLFVNSDLAGFFNYFYQYSHYANYLEDISVADKFKGQGCSKYLLSKYIEISQQQKSKNKIALSSTHKTNVASQRMHESFGFKKIGILQKLHYGEAEIFYAYPLE